MLNHQLVPYVADLEAVPSRQDDIRLFVGAAKARDLIHLTTVDEYKPSLDPNDPAQGYQRPPERSRITRIGKYLIAGEGGGLFPTAVLLAARTPLDYDRREGKVRVTSDSPLQIVDGQHRLAGLRYAIVEKDATALGDYSIPFVIMETPDRITEMKQFLIVNGTAKQVRTDLVNMILTATYADVERGNIPRKDIWKIVVSNVVDRLAKSEDSPWYEKIGLPGDAGKGTTKPIRATSLITSLRPVYMWLKDASGLFDSVRSIDDEIDLMYDIVVAYWQAIQDVVPDAFSEPTEFVIQKTPGVFSLHLLLRRLLGDMYRGRRNFDRETFREFVVDHPEITSPDFWRRGQGRASDFGSMKGFHDLFEILEDAYA